MNNSNSTSTDKGLPQFDKGQNPSSPVKIEPSIDKADASKQETKVAPAKVEVSGVSTR
jgi:hypothetical protein